MASGLLRPSDADWLVHSLPPTEVGGYPDIALQARLVADGRGLAPIPWVGTHGCVMSPLRGSIWCVALPWVTLRSTHGCDISPLCGSMWLPCNNYALCIMNYALKKAHGWDPITANAVPCGIRLLAPRSGQQIISFASSVARHSM